MSEPIAIIGAGGLGREVLSLIRALPHWNCVGFFDDGKEKHSLVNGLPLLGSVADIRPEEPLSYVLAIGDPKTKREIVDRLPAHLRFATLIHPFVVLQDADSIVLDPGVIIGAGSILTTTIKIGRHTLVNLNCTVGHDVTIGPCSSVMPGVNLAGSVAIGKGVLVGSGANVLNGISVGDFARVGSGAVVTRAVAPGVTVMGVPATPRSS